MNPVSKALWFIESHLHGDVTLEDVATASSVSRFHLVRSFGTATGQSVMRYVRGRRLTEAARTLAAGAPDILQVALNCGYGSHEAFTRAFRDQFGVTPETVRVHGTLDQLDLMEPLRMDDASFVELDSPRFEQSQALLIAGLGRRYDGPANIAGIPGQWEKFGPYLGHVPRQVGYVTYGVVLNSDEEGNFDYVCGVEVAGFSELPDEFTRVRIPPQRYAVFTHRAHVSTVRRTFYTIWNKFLPESGLQLVDGPVFERYDERFNPTTGLGGFEIWVPIAS